MALPTASEINVFDSLDERCACEHFQGKTLQQAEAMFRDNAMRYQEDLMWMGPIAFRYYLPAFISYIQSSSARGDADAINCFHGLVHWWIQHNRSDLSPVREAVESACRYILRDYDKFSVGAVYGDLSKALTELLAELDAPYAG
jgi:hypothetical protein